MDKLPVELLSKIMVHVVCRRTDIESWRCCPNHIADDNEYCGLPICRTMPDESGPLQLGMVCRFWKRTSEGTPALWNRIAVDINGTNDHNIEKTMGDLSKWLTRSRALPLEIMVLSTGDISDQRSKREARRRHTMMFLDELHLHSERFCSVSLHISNDLWTPSQYYRNSSHQLTHFCLVDREYSSATKHHGVKAFWPSLTHLELGFVHFGDLSTSLAGLTCLKLDCVEVPTPWKAIETAQQLTHLVIDCCSGADDETVSQSPVTLHSMKHFKYMPLPSSEDVFMALFKFPALDILTVRDYTESGCCIDNPVLDPFLSACANTLRRIVLVESQRTNPPANCERLIDVLSTLISVEYVELGLTNMPHSFFNPLLARLTAPEELSGATFLPNLHTLKFKSPNGISWPLIPSIFNRTGSLDRRPLRQLIVDNVLPAKAELLTIDVINKLVELLRDGIDIQLCDTREGKINLEESVHGWTASEP